MHVCYVRELSGFVRETEVGKNETSEGKIEIERKTVLHRPQYRKNTTSRQFYFNQYVEFYHYIAFVTCIFSASFAHLVRGQPLLKSLQGLSTLDWEMQCAIDKGRPIS